MFKCFVMADQEDAQDKLKKIFSDARKEMSDLLLLKNEIVSRCVEEFDRKKAEKILNAIRDKGETKV